MFEVGASYRIVTLETGENYEGNWSTYESSRVFEVGAVDGTLVKLLGPDFSKPGFDDLIAEDEAKGPREEIVLNTAGLFFVRAEKVSVSD